MRLVVIAVAVVVGFLLASTLALYSYGRFVERAQGLPSYSLPVSDAGTALDAFVAPMLAERSARSGLLLLDGNLDAFAIRALTARQSGRSLDLQYYIWDDDLTGRLLGGEVVKAADRGVRVRLLLDDINAFGRDSIYLALDAHPNIEVRLYNPGRARTSVVRRGMEMLLRAISITRRMHNKAWIADGRIAVVGGRNVGDAYFDAAQSANFRDLDLALLGDAVAQTEAVFDAYWNSKAVIPISSLWDPRESDLPELRRELGAMPADDEALPYLRRVAEDETVHDLLSGRGRIHWTDEAEVISDPPEKVIGESQDGWLASAVRPLLSSATTDLEIISPYFIPGDRFTDELVTAARRGVDVTVLTNSLAATDVAAVHGAYARYREPLIAGGVDLFELKPYDTNSDMSLFGSSSASLHTKAFTVDGRIGFIGSMNFDPRSISLNSEMGVVFADEALVAEVREIIADEISPSKSYRVLLEGGDLVWREEAGGATVTHRDEPGAGLWRRLTATMIGLLPIESQL